MGISTKTGDSGQTSLYSGERVWKDDPRVDAYGSLDELDAHIGEARHYVNDPGARDILEDVQEKLYRVMGTLASKSGDYPHSVTNADVEQLTALITRLEEKTPLKGFVLPGSLPSSAKLDICRTIARRAERHVVTLSRSEQVAPQLMQFVNRLSDLFFILARSLEAAEGAIRYEEHQNK
ncbi:MAG: cob(I)yrinic acid a,c-diamide adenosyltransferase [Candidatus Syntrophosphaera sp.]|nr:cob(I)yrinic acid a,c-diamide adenosyltransferase [Candidatus Syntrophosphaera sp.]